jgi:hypothetical protein
MRIAFAFLTHNTYLPVDTIPSISHPVPKKNCPPVQAIFALFPATPDGFPNPAASLSPDIRYLLSLGAFLAVFLIAGR